MTDQNQSQQQQQQPPADNQQQQQAPGPVPYERFKEINEKYKTLETQLAELQKKAKEDTDKQAAEQGKYKELYEKAITEQKVAQIQNWRLQVSIEKGIPPELAARLQGDTLEALQKDADTLTGFLKPKQGPGVPPPVKGGQPGKLDISSMTPKEIRENADKLWQQTVKTS